MRFKTDRAKIRAAQQKAVDEMKERAKELCAKSPETYQDIIDKVKVPISINEKGTAKVLVFSVCRDDEGDVNPPMLDARIFYKKAGEDNFIATKSGFRIPLSLALHIAGTIEEIVDDVKKAGVNDF